MIIIAHRGNLNGPNPREENKPDYVMAALKYCDVEVDVWFKHGKYYLGHDMPQYEVSPDFLLQKGIWCHAKNLEALEDLLGSDITYFWHETDAYTLVSNGYIWAYPGQPTTNRCITVTNDPVDETKIAGICTDYPHRYGNISRYR